MKHWQRPRQTPRSVLFLCTRNVCRGPMAAALLQRRKPAGCGRIIRSAGIEGPDGQAIQAVAREVLYKRGVDLTDHRSRTATPYLVEAFDLVLVMENRQRRWLEAVAPGEEEKTRLLGHWRGIEIRDPENAGRPEYEHIAEEIENCLADWTRYLFDADGSEPDAADVLPTPGL